MHDAPAAPSSPSSSTISPATSSAAITVGRAARSSALMRSRERRDAGVSTIPGQTQLTRIPSSASGASAAVRRIRPALAAA